MYSTYACICTIKAYACIISEGYCDKYMGYKCSPCMWHSVVYKSFYHLDQALYHRIPLDGMGGGGRDGPKMAKRFCYLILGCDSHDDSENNIILIYHTSIGNWQ